MAEKAQRAPLESLAGIREQMVQEAISGLAALDSPEHRWIESAQEAAIKPAQYELALKAIPRRLVRCLNMVLSPGTRESATQERCVDPGEVLRAE
jgi:hypothetical protein